MDSHNLSCLEWSMCPGPTSGHSHVWIMSRSAGHGCRATQAHQARTHHEVPKDCGMVGICGGSRQGL